MKKETVRAQARSYTIVTLACVLYALSFDWFYAPNDFTVGGFTGISQIINFFIPVLPVGVMIIVLNVPLFALGLKKFGFAFLVKSIYTMALSSVLIDVIAVIHEFAPMDPLLACLYGGVTLGIAFSANMLTMYLFYELLTLATLPLVMQPMTAAAKAAGIKYLLYSMSGAALAFIGLVFLILHDAQEFVPGGHLTAASGGDLSMLLPVFVLAFVGFGVKAALWPLHAWLPAAAVAPTPVTALLHAVAVVKAGAFACIRLVYYSCGTELLRGTWAQTVCIVLALVTILYGSCRSLKQRHFKRRLAYSTISNLSYILFAAVLMTGDALAAAFLHLITHSVVKIMAFFAAGAVLHYAHREYVDELEGLARHMPVTFACVIAAACGLTGIPPFQGFVSKWYIASAAVAAGDGLALAGFAVLLVSALLTAIYMFQVVIKAYFPRRTAIPPAADSVREAGWQMTVPMVILAAAGLLLGLFPQWLLDVIGRAVTL